MQLDRSQRKSQHCEEGKEEKFANHGSHCNRKAEHVNFMSAMEEREYDQVISFSLPNRMSIPVSYGLQIYTGLG